MPLELPFDMWWHDPYFAPAPTFNPWVGWAGVLDATIKDSTTSDIPAPVEGSIETASIISDSFAHGTGTLPEPGRATIPSGETSVLPEILTEGFWAGGAVLPTYTQGTVQENAEGELSMWEGWSDVADWAGGVIGDWINPATTPIWNYGSPAAPAPAVVPPAYGGPVVTPAGTPSGMYVDRHGHLVHRRRRRRRLLTESDFNDLMRIATLPNKQNVTVALAKAIGRR